MSFPTWPIKCPLTDTLANFEVEVWSRLFSRLVKFDCLPQFSWPLQHSLKGIELYFTLTANVVHTGKTKLSTILATMWMSWTLEWKARTNELVVCLANEGRARAGVPGIPSDLPSYSCYSVFSLFVLLSRKRRIFFDSLYRISKWNELIFLQIELFLFGDLPDSRISCYWYTFGPYVGTQYGWWTVGSTICMISAPDNQTAQLFSYAKCSSKQRIKYTTDRTNRKQLECKYISLNGILYDSLLSFLLQTVVFTKKFPQDDGMNRINKAHVSLNKSCNSKRMHDNTR